MFCNAICPGGDADGAACKLWDNQTMSVYFSTTKGVASVVMAMLVDRYVNANKILIK